MIYRILNRNAEKGLAIFGFLIYPLYTIPFIIKYILIKKKWAYFLLSLFMGILAYLLIPYDTFDITRHYEDFEQIREMGIVDIIELGGSHLFLNLVMWIVNAVRLPKESLPLIFTTLTYYIHYVTFLYIIEDTIRSPTFKENKKFYIFIFFFILFNQIRFIWAADGLRNALAFSISLLGVYLALSEKKNIKALICLCLSAFIHSSSTILIPLVFIAKINFNQKFTRLIFILSILIMFSGISDLFFFKIINSLETYLTKYEAYHPAYFDQDGEWGAGFWTAFNLKTIILEKYIKPLPFYIAIIYLFFTRKSDVPQYRNLLYFILFLISLSQVSRTIFDRYNYYAVLLFIMILMLEYKSGSYEKFKKKFLVFFIGTLLIFDLATIYQYRHTYIPSWYKMTYTPLPILLMKSISPKDYIIRSTNE